MMFVVRSTGVKTKGIALVGLFEFALVEGKGFSFGMTVLKSFSNQFWIFASFVSFVYWS